ncbi:hypothetical protein [Oscillatoria acuminata]|uniref:hypothetical protein n=1 Tax=Oscillatoria acuminata TaxID=118323 RepID=UPI0002DDE204|nr:hypothetical protein [Oscillatoria acuminata]
MLDPEEIPGAIALWEICVNNCESFPGAIGFGNFKQHRAGVKTQVATLGGG